MFSLFSFLFNILFPCSLKISLTLKSGANTVTYDCAQKAIGTSDTTFPCTFKTGQTPKIGEYNIEKVVEVTTTTSTTFVVTAIAYF